MKPSEEARRVAAITLSKGKMFEYGVPIEHHIELPKGLDLDLQFPLAIGTLGNAAADIVSIKIGGYLHARETQSSELLFAAQVLIAFVESRAAPEVSNALRLLAAAAFYLADAPGTATSLVKELTVDSFNKEDFLARAVRFALDKPWAPALAGVRDQRTVSIIKALRVHFSEGTSADTLLQPVRALREWSYACGSAHELLLADIFSATAFKRFDRSAWTCLPVHSELPQSAWAEFLSRPQAVKEMWPSQRMLGEAALYRGASSVVQMPTSAGKTRATELILRAAFSSNRTKLALVIAPFRALCQEIASDLQQAFQSDGFEVNQLSDAMQSDANAELAQWLALDGDPKPHTVVLTPEKLLYLLRQADEFVANVGVVIYDEGHQFDSGIRGATYELLLTSIKRLLPKSAQTVLISAVIKNADQLAGWLLDDPEKIVADKWLQTRRLIAFASFPIGRTGQLNFNAAVEGEQEFFVPRVMPSLPLRVTSRENSRSFPTTASPSVALYLGLKLVPNGGVAIYSRMPASASKLLRDAVKEVFDRDVALPPPSEVSDEQELGYLVRLFELNFGKESYLAKAAALGLFAHHGETPHGIRLIIEHAMRRSHIKFIICTATLAQGVNLPIRYLLITTPMQGRDVIKPRDFHNLIGRVGRAGMYGEGTVIFTDHRLFDTREDDDSYKWEAAQALLNPDSAAATGSTLLQLCMPLMSDNFRRELPEPKALEIALEMLEQPEISVSQFDNLNPKLVRLGFSSEGLRRQLSARRSIIEAIESFLMNYRGAQNSKEFFKFAKELGRETFAHAIGTKDQQQTIDELFTSIAERVERVVPEILRQERYGKSLFGVDRSLEIDAWVSNNLFELQICESVDDVVELVWPFLESLSVNKNVVAIQPSGTVFRLGKNWIKGKSFGFLLKDLVSRKAYIQQRTRRRNLNIEAVVGLCEQTFGYEFALYLTGIKSAFSALASEGKSTSSVEEIFDLFQKRIKYGLPNQAAIAYFELGFSERVMAQRIADIVDVDDVASKHDAKKMIRQDRENVRLGLAEFPSFFKDVFERVVR